VTQERDLLHAVADEPDDDAPRLVYADWLDDHDRPTHAEFIRAQLALAGLSEDSQRRLELAFRARQLLDAHEGEWIDRTAGVIERRWSRGFVEMLDIDPTFLHEDGEEVFDTLPLRRLILGDLFGKVDALELIPQRHSLTALDLIGNDLDLPALRELVKLDHLRGLSELGLMLNGLGDSAVEFLCAMPFFQGLSLLRLGCNPFTEDGRQRLRDHFGERVSFAREREPDRLYTIQDEYLRVGWGHDHTQFLMLAGAEEARVALFDHAGNLLRTEARPVPRAESGRYPEQEAHRVAVRDAWLAELGYQSATVQVKRFQFPDGAGITDFNWWADAFDQPGDPQRAELRERIDRWLVDGQFRFDFGGSDCWLARDGQVTDT
jgi:uncharacterized protein (TIGR02996 family)